MMPQKSGQASRKDEEGFTKLSPNPWTLFESVVLSLVIYLLLPVLLYFQNFSRARHDGTHL